MGEASWQASEILEYLNGQIKRDQLAQELTSTIDGLTSGLDQARAAITAEKTERVDADGALATRVDTTLAVANGAAAGVQESRTALAGLDGQLKATWSVKAQVTGRQGLCGRHVAGGLHQSRWSGAKLGVLPGRPLWFPELGQWGRHDAVRDRERQTVINDAVIGTGRITNAMIRDLHASKITAGQISADKLNVDQIAASLANVGQAYIKKAHIVEAQVDTLSIAGNAVTIPVSWSGLGEGAVALSSNVPGKVVIFAYRSSYRNYATPFRVYVNGTLVESEDGIHYAQSTETGSSIYTAGPLTVIVTADVPAGNSVISVNSRESLASSAKVRIVALMVKR